MSRRLPELLPEGVELGYVGRPTRASTGEGYSGAHAREQERIVLTALTPGVKPDAAKAGARAPLRWVKRLSLGRAGDLLGPDRVLAACPGSKPRRWCSAGRTGSASSRSACVIWIACVRREAPYTLLAATLTPVGPVGSVIGIELIERKGWGVRRVVRRTAAKSP